MDYGLTYGETCIEWFSYLQGTRYELSKEKQKFIVDFYLDGAAKMSAFGKYIAVGAANRIKTRFEKNNIYSSSYLKKIAQLTDYRKDEVEELIALRDGKLDKPTLSFSKYFWQSEYFVFQRPDFYSTVRMYSIRNANTELPHNGEGIYDHHIADGANHTVVDGNEFLNIYPVYDWQKVPGTTVLQKKKLQHTKNLQKYGLTDFVGATTDGMYGVVGFDFTSPHDGIRAQKSWFFFDHEYVCLGAGIASNIFNSSVATTINQSLLKGDVIAYTENGNKILEKGEHKFENIKWLYHDKIAYIFPDSTNLHLSNKTETGRWADINFQSFSSKETENIDVFKLWIDHGARPQGDTWWLYPDVMHTKDITYSYIVVPNADPSTLNTDRALDIIENNHKIQAVYHKDLEMLQVVFYQAAKVSWGENSYISSDSPCIIMLKMKDGKLTQLTASDPSRKLSKLHLNHSEKGAIVVELPKDDFKGASVIVKF